MSIIVDRTPPLIFKILALAYFKDLQIAICEGLYSILLKFQNFIRKGPVQIPLNV